MKPILRIILSAILLYSCAEKLETPDTFKYDTEVIYVLRPFAFNYDFG